MSEFIVSCIKLFYANYSISMTILMGCIMGVIVCLLQLVKIPIKKLTSKISNERLRKLANKSIILLAYVVSIAIWFILNWIIPKIAVINWTNIFLTGSLAIVAYSLGEGVLTKSKANEALKDIIDITKDGKIDEQDSPALKDYYDKVK